MSESFKFSDTPIEGPDSNLSINDGMPAIVEGRVESFNTFSAKQKIMWEQMRTENPDREAPMKLFGVGNEDAERIIAQAA